MSSSKAHSTNERSSLNGTNRQKRSTSKVNSHEESTDATLKRKSARGNDKQSKKAKSDVRTPNHTQRQSPQKSTNTHALTQTRTSTDDGRDNSDEASAAPLTSSSCTVHRCRFVRLHPAAITALAFSRSYPRRLAVGRSSGTIEVFDAAHLSFIKSVEGDGVIGIQSLIWIDARLISGGMNGAIIEYDLTSLRPRFATESYGGAVWSMSLHSSTQRIAVGCEDGSVRVFDGATDIAYVKALSVQSRSRTLSVDWDQPGDRVVSAHSDGSIRIHSYMSGQMIQRMQTDTDPTMNKLSALWSVRWIHQSHQLVTGNSRGAIQFWDVSHGTLMQTFTHHSADVLSVCVSDDGQTVYSGSVDQSISELKRITADEWRLSGAHRAHTHDVYAVALSDTSSDATLASGGVDTQLCLSRLDTFHNARPIKILPFGNRKTVAVNKYTFLVHDQHKLSLYKLGKYVHPDQQDEALSHGTSKNQTLQLQSSYSHLLDIDLSRSTDDDEQSPWSIEPSYYIKCSALSSDGLYIACSDMLIVRIFDLSSDRIKRCIIDELSWGANALIFTADSKHLIVCGLDGVVRCVELCSMTLVASVQHARNDEAQHTLTHAATNHNSSLVAVCDDSARVHVYSLPKLNFEWTLPQNNAHVTAMAYHPHNNALLIATADHDLFIYDNATQSLTEWSRHHYNKLRSVLRHSESVTTITFDPTAHDTIALATRSAICIVNTTADMKVIQTNNKRSHNHKRLRTSNDATDQDSQTPTTSLVHGRVNGVRLLTDYASMIHGGFLPAHTDRSALVVEVPWISVMQTMTEPIQRKQYGT